MIEFGILGPLEARGDGEPLALGGRNRRSVLAVLLLESDRVVSIDRLADELYGDETPVSAVTQVHRQISELRRVLGAAVIETRPPGYRLRLAGEQLDVRRFEGLTAQADAALAAGDPRAAAAALDAALALWRGRPLADLADEPFARRPVARLEELRVRALERRMEAVLALGRHADAVTELSDLAAEHPLRERLRELLMVALYRAGRQVEALDVYRRTRAELVEAFGVEPGPGLQRIEAAILRHDPALAAPAPPAEQTTRAVLVAGRDAVSALVALAAPLARRPGHELLVARLLRDPADVPAATAELAAERARHAEPMRVAAFVPERDPDDVLALADAHDAALVLVEAGDDLAAFAELLTRSPADVALVSPGREPGRGVVVPFGGGEHDWAAMELGAWLAGTTGDPLRLAGAPDATRVLADASLALQRLVGVIAEPLLVEASPAGLLEASAGARAVVIGLPARWRREGLGAARRALVGRAPVLFVHRGPRPGGLAPREARTRFTWSADQRTQSAARSTTP